MGGHLTSDTRCLLSRDSGRRTIPSVIHWSWRLSFKILRSSWNYKRYKVPPALRFKTGVQVGLYLDWHLPAAPDKGRLSASQLCCFTPQRKRQQYPSSMRFDEPQSRILSSQVDLSVRKKWCVNGHSNAFRWKTREFAQDDWKKKRSIFMVTYKQLRITCSMMAGCEVTANYR